MSLVGLNIVVLDGTNYPSMVFIGATGVSVTIDSNPPVVDSALVSTTVSNTDYHTVTITKTGYNTYTSTFLITNIVPDPGDYNLFVSLTSSVLTNVCQYITITKGDCHNFTFVNSATSSINNVTFSITDLDNNPITGYTDIVLNYGSTTPFISTSDNIYIATIKDTSEVILCQYVIIDYCSILSCYKNKYLNLICDCDCSTNDCTDFCKLDFEMKRLHLLWFDLFNRINSEYRTNSIYTTIDDIRLSNLVSAKLVMDKILGYCSDCETSSNPSIISNNTNSDCGCS